jgi:hypothetical protein
MFQLPYPIFEQKILFVALNWGDGHTMRSIPILMRLQMQKNEIHVIGTVRQNQLIESYFTPDSMEVWDGLSVDFKGFNSFGLELFFKFPKWRKEVYLLKEKVKALVKNKKFDLLISDHIYSMNFPEAHSIFLTHQLNYKTPFMEAFVRRVHQNEIRKFDEIWVLDTPERVLAGELSDPKYLKSVKIYFIGWPSRFENRVKVEKKFQTYLLTGPEPYRSQLLKQFEQQINWGNENYRLIGVASEYEMPLKSKIRTVSRDNQEEIDNVLSATITLHSRGGYTTLLDKQTLGFQMENYPTPGQYEQIYLNNWHKKKASK